MGSEAGLLICKYQVDQNGLCRISRKAIDGSCAVALGRFCAYFFVV